MLQTVFYTRKCLTHFICMLMRRHWGHPSGMLIWIERDLFICRPDSDFSQTKYSTSFPSPYSRLMTRGFVDSNKQRIRLRDGLIIVFSLLKTVFVYSDLIWAYKKNSQSILPSIKRKHGAHVVLSWNATAIIPRNSW